MRIVLCDRCGAKIIKGTTIGHVNAWYEDLKDLDKAKPEYNGWDFCPECMEAIDGFIKTPLEFVTPEEVPVDAEFVESLEEELDAEPEDEAEDEDEEPEPADEWEAAEQKARKAGPDAKAHGQIRKKADWPKFKACIDAGKDNKWLAVEFGVTTGTIWSWKKKLKEMEAKGQIK